MTTKFLKAFAYERFSSEMQREESIDAQKRAIEDYCSNKNIKIVRHYTDRGVSATTANRPEFQNMIHDSEESNINFVIVHKFDRFSRDKYDSITNKKKLIDNGIRVISVSEPIDNTPEGILLEGMIESYSQFYTQNLAREVEKGRRENAYKCMHIGGKPPYGYNVDKLTKRLIVNEKEAVGIRLIFKLLLDGNSYPKIADALNKQGITTSKGNVFGKNSLHEILINEKYTGVYIYNKSASKDRNNKRNGHRYKSDDEIIRVENGVPQIVSKEDFVKVQEIIRNRKKNCASNKAKETYLLSGKIFCGICGSTYGGNSRKARPDHKAYVGYRCVKKNGKIKCSNQEVNRTRIEALVLDKLSDYLFNSDKVRELTKTYNEFIIKQNQGIQEIRKNINDSITSTNMKISNLLNVIENSGSYSVAQRITELEKIKGEYETSLFELESSNNIATYSEQDITKQLRLAKTLFRNGSLKSTKTLINRFVDCVLIFPDKIEIKVNFDIDKSYNKKELINAGHKDQYLSESFEHDTRAYYGGEGGI